MPRRRPLLRGDGAGSRTPAATSSIFAATRRLTERTASVDGSASKTEHMLLGEVVREALARVRRRIRILREPGVDRLRKVALDAGDLLGERVLFDAFVGVLPPLAVGDLEGGGRLSFFGRSGRPSGPRSCASSDGGGGRRCRASARATSGGCSGGPGRARSGSWRGPVSDSGFTRASRVRRAFG